MSNESQTHIFTALVSNQPGVLNRMSGMFSRRGYNIESLSVASTEDERFSRMTIVVNGDDYVIEQVTKQLHKLYDVKRVARLDRSACVNRELLLVKIRCEAARRPEIETTVRLYKAKAVDVSPGSVTIELTGESNKIDGFVNVIKDGYEIIELARTGTTALARGDFGINDR